MDIGSDSRGVSESAGVAVLITITVLVVAAVGISVIVTGEDDGPVLEFQFVHSDELGQLTIIYQDEEEIPAGEIYVDGPAANVTWAALADIEPEDSILTVDTVFVRDRGAYGTDVSEDDYFRVVYIPADGEKEVVAEWNADVQEEDPGPGDATDPFD